jgi:hypothetical protein
MLVGSNYMPQAAPSSSRQAIATDALKAITLVGSIQKEEFLVSGLELERGAVG